MNYAVIDIGSNSIRLLKCLVESGEIVRSEKRLNTTRLGKGVNDSGMLAEDRMRDSVDAIADFVDEAKAEGISRIVAMATSAVRDASNQAVFLEAVLNRTGIAVDVLSGEVEAEIGFLGVLKGIHKPFGALLVIDIGGGSTELIRGNAQGIIEKISLNIGAVRLTDMFMQEDKLLISALRTHVEHILSPYKAHFTQDANQSLVAVGIGGTASTFAAMALALNAYDRDRVHGFKVSKAQIQVLNRKLQSVDLETRKKIPGLDPKRADIIIAGGLILNAIIEDFGYEFMMASDYDNLEGYLYYKCLDI